MSVINSIESTYAFIILHYMNCDVTINCIKSILEFYLDKKIFIIVIDNNSPNNSLEVIKKVFDLNTNIFYIKNNMNLGFSKANNIGISFAREKFDPDFYIVINSDIEFIQKEFLDNINCIYLRESFDVLGPDILCNIDGKLIHSSPHSLTVPDKKSIRTRLISLYIKRLRIIYKPFDVFLFNIGKLFKVFKKNGVTIPIDYSKEYFNPKLQGSCYIFSKKYVASKGNVFCEDIFFYGEEDATSYYAKIEKRIVLYSPIIKVVHKAYGSLDKTCEDNNAKRKFIIDSYINAYRILIKLMNEKPTKKN